MLKRVISVIALFDDEGDKKIRDIQNIMQQSPSWLNDLLHLTLAVYDKPLDEGELINWIVNVSERHKAFNLDLVSIGVFHKSCIFAMPRLAKEMYQLYMNIHDRFEDQCRDYLKPSENKWFPHVGLLYTDIENACNKLPVLIQKFEETRVRVNRLRITIREEEHFRILYEVSLN
ncbi:MAG: hypothetical protein JEZ08_09470 [Clostridiales bacterium]|nr:hypothetical protein [Clostridiales bacterium]